MAADGHGAHDDREDRHRGAQGQRGREQADADGRDRHAGVDAGDEGSGDLATALDRGELVDVGLRTEKGEAMAGAAQHGAGEEGHERVQREGEHERQEPGHDERQAQRLDAGRAAAARDEQLRGARGGQQRGGDRPEQGEVAGVEQLRGVARHHREVQRRNHPHRGRGETRRARSRPGWRGAPTGAACASAHPTARLGDRHDGGGERQRQHERHEVTQHARRGRPLRERPGEQRTGAAARALDEHRVQRRAPAIAMWLELDQSGRGRTGDHPDRQALDRSRGEQPRRVLRRGEQRQADGGRHEAPGDHALAPDAVRQLPAHQQRGHEHDHVRREDQGEHGAREPEALAVDRVQRRRQVAAEQQREERHRQDQERPAGAFGHLTQVAATALRHWCKRPGGGR